MKSTKNSGSHFKSIDYFFSKLQKLRPQIKSGQPKCLQLVMEANIHSKYNRYYQLMILKSVT